jgi:hypothetical protein
VKLLSFRLGFILISVALATVTSMEVYGDDWVFYSGSDQEPPRGAALRDWYELNRIKPVAKGEAKTHHYFDQDSAASSSPSPGGSVRVWEKGVLQRETQGYEEAKARIEKEEEKRLNRKISVLDYAWIFPMAVNRVAKEVRTLYEIDCDSKEFFILEGNCYDKAGQRMTREATFDMELWLPIQPGTVMEALYNNVCSQ